MYGYGPDGPWEEVTQPPIFSVLKTTAVPSNKPGLALATAIAVQNKVRRVPCCEPACSSPCVGQCRPTLSLT